MPHINRRKLIKLGVGAIALPELSLGAPTTQDSIQASEFINSGVKGFVFGTVRNRDALYFDAAAMLGVKYGRIFFPFIKCRDCEKYGQTYEYISSLKKILELTQNRGMKLILVGEFPGSELPEFWKNTNLQDSFVENWRSFSKMFGKNPTIAGLDLLNEPNPPWINGKLEESQKLWRDLAEKTIGAIRAEGVTAPIVFEGVAGGSSLGLRGMTPLLDSQVVYSIHFYTPHDITHQHVNPSWQRTIPYPAGKEWELGKWDPQYGIGEWNRQRLEIELRDAIAFQKNHKVPIYVGEFSCVRWAPGDSRERYIADCLSIFRKYGWSWTYHEFRGWPGWDAEIVSADRNATTRSIDAPVMKLIRNEIN